MMSRECEEKSLLAASWQQRTRRTDIIILRVRVSSAPAGGDDQEQLQQAVRSIDRIDILCDPPASESYSRRRG